MRLRAGNARAPVLIVRDYLHTCPGSRRNLSDGRHLLLNRLHVVIDQRLRGAAAQPYAAFIHAAGTDVQQVRSHRRNLVLHLLLRSLPQSHRGDHCSHADHNAQHRQQ